MAGIGIFNFDIDAKSVEPIAILALCGAAGYFLWRHLQATQAAAASASDPANSLSSQVNSEYDQALQMAELQTMFGGSSTSATVSNSASATLQTVAPVTSNASTTNAGQSTGAASGSSSEVGSAPSGSV